MTVMTRTRHSLAGSMHEATPGWQPKSRTRFISSSTRRIDYPGGITSTPTTKVRTTRIPGEVNTDDEMLCSGDETGNASACADDTAVGDEYAHTHEREPSLDDSEANEHLMPTAGRALALAQICQRVESGRAGLRRNAFGSASVSTARSSPASCTTTFTSIMTSARWRRTPRPTTRRFRCCGWARSWSSTSRCPTRRHRCRRAIGYTAMRTTSERRSGCRHSATVGSSTGRGCESLARARRARKAQHDDRAHDKIGQG